jgi:hypothetical protein
MNPKTVMLCVAAATLFFTSPAVAAPTEAQACLAAKEKVLAKYESCVWKAYAKGTITSTTVDTSLCQTKFEEGWAKPDAKYGLDCPSTPAATITNLFGQHVDAVLDEIAPNFNCGNGNIDGSEQCDGANLNGSTCQSLGYGGGTLACSGTCTYDTSACDSCDLHTQDCAQAGQACYPINNGDPVCAGEGTTTEGGGCMYINSCVAGYTCVNDGGAVCREICQPSNPSCSTPGRTCTAIPEWGSDAGVCIAS